MNVDATTEHLVVISDLHDPGAVSALRHCAQGHDCMVMHLQDPAEAGNLRAGFIRGVESETGQTFLAHSRTSWAAADSLRTDLARCGVDYLRLSTTRPFVAPLRHFLSSRGGLMRGRG